MKKRHSGNNKYLSIGKQNTKKKKRFWVVVGGKKKKGGKKTEEKLKRPTYKEHNKETACYSEN